ncbi:MAG: MMPL family transporter, partial [Methylomonas sp.]
MRIDHHAAKLAECFARNPKWVLGLALVFSLLAAWGTAQLPVLTSRQALLPQNTPVAQRFNDFLNKFGAASDLIVVLEGVPRNELESFANELAAKLRVEPEIGQATSRLDMGFFLEHAYLLMPVEALDKLAAMANDPSLGKDGLEGYLNQALSWSKDHPALGGTDIDLATAEASLNLATVFLDEWLRWLSDETPPAGLEWGRLLAKSGGKGMTDGYFASHDGRMLFLFVHPKSPSGDFQKLGPFVDKVRQVSANLAEQSKLAGHMPPTVGLTGLPAIEYEEYVNVRKDITMVILTAAGLIAALVLIVVRSVRWAVLIFVPMSLGVLWSLGLALVTVGHLTIITATFIAILFGLGADYGIFTSSRIAEERRAGKPLIEAIGAGVGSSFIAVLTAGGASLLIFGILASVDFPGFAELGIVAAKGVLLILISTWMVQPALYALFPPKLRGMVAPGIPAESAQPSKHGGSFPMPIAVGLVVVAISFAVFGGVKGLSIPFDYDLLGMLPKDSEAAYYQRRMVAESDYQAEVIIFTARDMAEARRITKEAGKLKTIAQTQSLTDLFPEDAEQRRLKAISIGEAFDRAGFAGRVADLERTGLSPNSFELLQAVLKNAIAFIDEAEEQAFSAGHAKLVENLEKVRGQLLAISAKLTAEDEQGRVSSERFLRALLSGAEAGLKIIDAWRRAEPLTPEQLPATLRDRFFGADGSIAVYAFPAKSVYDPANLDALIKDVYSVSP